MVSFCEEILREIKTAENEAALIKVIGNSLQMLQERGNYNEDGYIMNMVVSLRALHTEELSIEALNNVTLATAIFRQFQKGKSVRLF